MRNVILTAAVAVLSLGAGSALADDTTQPELLTPFGMSAEAGGGVIGFLSKEAAGVSRVGGSWDARLLLGTRTHFAGELAYVGTAQHLTTLGVADNAVLHSNGIEGMVRFNFATGDWQPYAAAGYTWRHYLVGNSAINTSSVAGDVSVGAIPVSLGVAWRHNGLVADLRFTARGAFQSNLIPNSDLSTVGVAARLGVEF